MEIARKQSPLGTVPSDWEVYAVKGKGRVQAGKALAIDAAGPLRPYLRTKNVLDGQICLDDVLYMPMTDDEFERHGVLNGDVLLNEGQTTELVGRCAKYSGEFGARCAMQNQLVRFRAHTNVSPAFAAHLFRRCQHSGVFSVISTQTTSVAHLGVSRFANLELGWPTTRAEQEAIAEALSDADALIESLEQLIVKKRLIKQGVMQELLTGKRRLPGFKRKPGFKQTELGAIPEDWEVKKLLSLVAIPSGQVDPKVEPYRGMALIAPDHIESMTGRLLTKATASAQGAISGKYLVAAGDVVYSKIRPHLRKAALVDFDALCSADMYPLRPHEGTDRGYVFAMVLGEHFSKFAESVSARSGMPKINRSELAEYSCACPLDREEQEGIGLVLLEMNAEIDGIDLRLAKARLIKQGMMQQLLTGRIRLV